MRKILLFPLVALFIFFGFLYTTNTALAATDITVTWTAPISSSSISTATAAKLESADWVNVPIQGNIMVNADVLTNFSIRGVLPATHRKAGTAVLKLFFPGAVWGGNPTNPITSTRIVKITATDAANGYLTLTGTTYATGCTNSIDLVYYGAVLYIEALGPYSTESCPEDSVKQNGICISETTTTPISYSTESCPPGSIIQNGICISKTTTTPISYSTESCPAGSIIQNGICISETTTTPIPYSTSDCPPGSIIQNGICILTDSLAPPPPPFADNLSVALNYCAGLATFNWNYNDIVGNDPETAWQLQVSTDSNFSNIAYESCDEVINGDCDGSAESVTILVSPALNYGTSYYWRVRVWDDTTVDPAWTDYPGTFATYPHQAPAVSYAMSPVPATVNQEVSFTDNNSMCWLSSGAFYSCNIKDENTYQWWFGDDSDTGSTAISCSVSDATICGNASHTYDLSGSYSTELQVCDDIGCCYTTASLYVEPVKANTVPQWWEITPYR